MIPNNPDEPSPGGARHAVIVPIGLLVLVLLPLLLMPLAAIFVFAFRGGLTAFLAALSSPDAHSPCASAADRLRHGRP